MSVWRWVVLRCSLEEGDAYQYGPYMPYANPTKPQEPLQRRER